MAQGAAGKAPAPADPKAAPAGAGPAAAPTPTPAPSPADAEKDAAKLFEDGKKAAKANQWEKARDAAAAAFKLKPDPAFALVLGQGELRTGKPRDAAEHLDLFLRDAKNATADEKFVAQKALDEAKTKVGAWYLKVNVDGADVILDGKTVGRTPLPAPLYLDPGNHELEVKKFGFQSGQEQIAAGPGNGYETEVTLAQAAAPPPDKPADVKPKEPKEEPPPPPPPSPQWRTYGMIGGGALTVLGLGLGVGLTVAANGKSDDADAQLAAIVRLTPNTMGLCGATAFAGNKAACAELKNTLSSQDAYANGAMVGYVIGGVAALGTVGLFLLPKLPFGRKLMGVNIVPVVGKEQTGGVLVGSF